MKNEDVVTYAAIGFLGLVVAPVVIGTAINLGNMATVGVMNGVNKIKFKKRIKKGLEEGTIVENDGMFYTIELETDHEEA